MRTLVLALLVLLCVLISGAAFLWVGRGGDGVPPDALVTSGSASDLEAAALPFDSELEAARRSESAAESDRVNVPSKVEPRARRTSEVELILKAPRWIAKETPLVYLLRAKDSRKGATTTLGRRGPQASDARWRWDRAVAFGEEIFGVPAWSPDSAEAKVDPQAADDMFEVVDDPEIRARLNEMAVEDRAPQVVRMLIPRPGRLDRVLAKAMGRVSIGSLRGSEIVIDFDDCHERQVDVEVRHAGGAPAVHVSLVMSGGGSRTVGDLRTGGRPLSELPRTGDDGRASVMKPRGSLPRALVLGLPPIGKAGQEAIMLPPVGAIEIEYEYGEEHRHRGSAVKRATLEIGPADGAKFTYDGTWQVTTPIVNGRATLHHVALGQRFRLTVEGYIERVDMNVAGPTEHGEVVVVQLSPTVAPRLRFKALDEAGRSLKGEVVRLLPKEQMHAALSHDSRGDWAAITDEEGVATFQLKGIAQDDVLGEIFASVSPSAGSTNVSLVARRLVQEPFVDGLLDLGSWSFRPMKHLVSGRVIHQSGAPVVGATVRVIPVREASDVSFGMSGVRQCLGLSGEDGQFTIRWERDTSADGSRKLALTATKGALKLIEAVPFKVGDRDVALELNEPGGIRIDLTEIDPKRMQGLRLMLETEDPAGADPSSKPVQLQPGELMELNHQRPGRYACRISLPPESVTLAENLVIQPGELLADPRLNPVTLGTAVQRRVIFVTGANGAAIPSVTIGRVRVGEVDHTSRIDAENGAFDVLAYLESPPDSYWIEANGYARATVEALREGASIELLPAIQVTIQLTGSELPTQAFRMSAIWMSDGTAVRRETPITFDSLGRGTLEAPQPGAFMLTQMNSGRGRTASPAATKPWWGATFTVPKGGGNVEIEAQRTASTSSR